MSKRSKPLPRGFVNNIILQSLVDGDKYGYEIIKEVEEITGGEIILKQPSLYSSLKRFETRGFISSYWGDSTIGGRRHYYTLTEAGREFFEQQIKSGEISVEDIVYENVEEEVKAEINEQAEKALDENTDSKDDKATSEDTKQKEYKPVVVDTDSEDYNVFDLLESETKSLPEKETKTAETEVENENFEETKNNDELSENLELNEKQDFAKQELESEQPETIDNYTDEIQEYLETYKNETLEKETSLVDYEKELDAQNPIAPLPEQTSLNLDHLEEVNENFDNDNKIDFITTAEENSNEVLDNYINASDYEETKTIEKPKAEILVDEYGIKKSSLDTAPQRKTKHVDNVGTRRQYIDPLYRTTNSEKTKQEQESVKEKSTIYNKTEAVKTYNKANFEESERKISEKIQKAVIQKFGKIESLDYKNLLGEVYFDEKEIEHQKLESETIKLPDSYDDSYFESYESEEEVSTIKNTPYTSLEESLEKEGFKFKPYNIKFTPSKKRPEFLLSNKAGFYLGLIMFVLMLAQFTAFGIYLANSNFTFKSIDKVIVGMSLGTLVLVLLAGLIPYITNRKKRKYNSFKLSTTMVYMLVVFTSLLLLTYAVNSFFGLTFKNMNNYIVTLFLPIIVFANLLIAPIVYRLLITNKKFY